jgi:hypothetical protein
MIFDYFSKTLFINFTGENLNRTNLVIFKIILKMKKLIIVVLSMVCFMACKTENSKATSVETKTEVKTDAAQVYACPMDPEIKGKKGDKCSKCGMNLVHKD